MRQIRAATWEFSEDSAIAWATKRERPAPVPKAIGLPAAHPGPGIQPEPNVNGPLGCHGRQRDQSRPNGFGRGRAFRCVADRRLGKQAQSWTESKSSWMIVQLRGKPKFTNPLCRLAHNRSGLNREDSKNRSAEIRQKMVL